jgi:hypothetical protein
MLIRMRTYYLLRLLAASFVLAAMAPGRLESAQEELPWLVHMSRADAEAARGHWTEAKVEYERAARAPGLCLTLNAAAMRLVRIYAREQSLERATNDWTARLANAEKNANRREMLLPLGMVALLANERGEYPAAIAALERFRRLQAELEVPADAHGATLLAFLYLATGATERASSLFAAALLPDAEGRKAIEAYPDPFDQLLEEAVSTWRALLTEPSDASACGKRARLQDVERRFARLSATATATLGTRHPNVATILDAHAAVVRKLTLGIRRP